MKSIAVLVLAMLMSACASSPYTYHVEPTPIKKQKTAYKISEVKVNLTLGHGAILGDDSFVDGIELQRQFTEYLESSLNEKGIHAQDEKDYLEVTFNIDFTRVFNVGGKALNKPEVTHFVTVSSNGKNLASFSQGPYTTKYSLYEDIAVNLKIAAFLWGKEDEPKDVKFISQLIIDDLANLGR